MEKPTVQFRLALENEGMNASSTYVEDRKYNVSFNYAGYVLLYNFFNKYLQRSDFFSFVTLGKKVSDELRDGYLTLLLDISIQLIIFHELGHIYNGHLDYFAKEKKMMTLYEADSEMLEFEDALMRQALEWNADEFAATHLASFYEIEANCDAIYVNNPIMGFWLILACTITVFSFMGVGKEDDKAKLYKHKSHLPLRYRVMKIIESNIDSMQVLNNYRFKFSIEHMDIQKMIIELEKCCDSYINNSGFSENRVHNPYYNWNEFDEEHEEHYLKVDQFFMHEMTDAIEPYSYLISSQYSCKCNREYMGREKYDELKQLIENSIEIEFDNP